MNKFSKIIAWAYLAVGFVFLVEVFTNWNTDRQKSYVSLFMAALAFFMFVFKRKFRSKQMKK
ncbi:hypothetical protein [Wenyingzhuangia aestuarii]|uniref:hypothetical protein n=1 Tax=Wenyingzhuangia aestuarii TaxID=1647582 RepID=UPI00143B9C3D|nr:hypothetical protein [Wenyingzhuangia aestuarii]NJB82257.1 hypothetical protein [Wenyingzhuangia aestuarii]